ncbi:glycosyltransferase [Vibrio sp. B1Z05]|uniref:glycosyltransferase n=1 Tax=Vibrio sp. B1Z05 TaxID=2654980 RepID=UPI00128BFDC5|nr:glycosyltransferase [Vibrio sp. B1Z05]MPW36434.1 glycosyltransferase [Vibrio sp. B1Z05]
MKKGRRTIIHVVQHLAPGGIESLALDFITFGDANDDVYIVSLQGTKTDAIAKWPRLQAFSQQLIFLNKPERFCSKTISDLCALFKRLSVDVVHTHHIGPLLYAGVAAKLSGVRSKVHTEHDVWHLNRYKHQQIQKLLLNWVKPVLVADAVKVEQRLNDLFVYAKLTTIHNGIDTKHFLPGDKLSARNTLNIPKNATIIGSAGRLEAVKGHDLLIHAFSLLPKQYVLAIAGDGSQMTSLIGLVKSLNLQERVLFLGRVDNMPCFYQSLDLFCLPSRHEGFPLTAIEAQACAIPTLVTDVGASNETLCPNSGRLVAANSPSELASAIESFQFNTGSPRDFVVKNHDIRDVVTRYSQLFAKEA